MCYQPFCQLHSDKTCSLSPSKRSSVVPSCLQSPTQFSSLDVNSATDTLCSTLTSCLDNICPLSSRPAHSTPSNPRLSDVLHETLHPNSRMHDENGTNPADLSMYQSTAFFHYFFCKGPHCQTSYFHNKINSYTQNSSKHSTLSSAISHHLFNS